MSTSYGWAPPATRAFTAAASEVSMTHSSLSLFWRVAVMVLLSNWTMVGTGTYSAKDVKGQKPISVKLNPSNVRLPLALYSPVIISPPESTNDMVADGESNCAPMLRADLVWMVSLYP